VSPDGAPGGVRPGGGDLMTAFKPFEGENAACPTAAMS
jgi:hypothetical protein